MVAVGKQPAQASRNVPTMTPAHGATQQTATPDQPVPQRDPQASTSKARTGDPKAFPTLSEKGWLIREVYLARTDPQALAKPITLHTNADWWPQIDLMTLERRLVGRRNLEDGKRLFPRSQPMSDASETPVSTKHIRSPNRLETGLISVEHG